MPPGAPKGTKPDRPIHPAGTAVGSYRSLTDPASLQHFIENLREGIYITARDGQILDANPAFLAIFGVASVAELRGLRAEDLIVEPERRAQELERIEREGAVREFELTLRRPDGQLRTVLDTCYAVVDPETGERLYHGILVDITARCIG